MRKPNYDKYPVVEVKTEGTAAWAGYEDILYTLKGALGVGRAVLAVDCYPGVRKDEVLPKLVAGLSPALVIDTDTLTLDKTVIDRMLERNLTDDRVFGVMSHHRIDEFFDKSKVAAARAAIATGKNGVVLVYGVGAAYVTTPDVLVYADLARWEIQQRYRSGEIANWCSDNFDEEPLRKYKRGFFIEWRVADRHKKTLFDRMDFVLDTNVKDSPRMITGGAMRDGLAGASARPFRVVPFFDPGVWGGQWMKDVCGLDKSAPNYAWCFDCVPEENSLLLECSGVRVEIPSINLVFRHPVALLGDKVHARFGTEFPIRFDFLDTMQGQNLSLQVHPLTEYIQDAFGMHYTQDESYYILEAGDEAVVYLGLRDGVDSEKMIEDLRRAQETAEFDACAYVNEIPAKKHDHFLIPAGTVHCSGSNTMVLEISATPFIFTFKLWDWDRVGLDGRPRPVHIDHGAPNIQFDRTTDWTMKNLVNRVEPLASGDGWREERTGLHERQFIETRRHIFTKPVAHHTGGGVNVMNLVQGTEAVVSSPTGAFEPYVVHYAESFIVPASVGAYVVSPTDKSQGEELVTIKAFVRTGEGGAGV